MSSPPPRPGPAPTTHVDPPRSGTPPHPSEPPAAAGGDRYLLASPHQRRAFALTLACDFEQAHAAALTDARGVVVDGTILSDRAHGFDHAVGFALCLALAVGEAAAELSFFSVVEELGPAVAEHHVARFLGARAVFDGVLHVGDWILTDGRLVQSVACAVDAGAP